MVLGPLFFLNFINSLPRGLHAHIKLSADETSLFPVVDDIDESAFKLNNNLIRIQEWAYKRKMSFNPDSNRTKPAHEVIFPGKTKNIIYPNLYFNNVPIVKITSQKHLGLDLDVKPTFNDHINEKIGKAMKSIGFFSKLQYFLPRSSMLTIYKSFIRPHLEYGDAICDQPLNAAFSSKIESIQCNASLEITGTIRGLSREKLYQELALGYLHDKRWIRRLCLFYKVLLNKVPKYIYELIPPLRHSFRNSRSFTSFTYRTEYFKNSFFPSVINDWNKLDPKIRNSNSYLSF